MLKNYTLYFHSINYRYALLRNYISVKTYLQYHCSLSHIGKFLIYRINKWFLFFMVW